MRMAMLLFGVLLGMGGILLYQWVKPPSEDPYFFLSPKPTIINDEFNAIEKPIKLYQKGESVAFIFWKVPQPMPKLLYLIPTNLPFPEIMLVMKGNGTTGEYKKANILTQWNDDRGTWEGIKSKDDRPFLKVTIKKIEDDLSEKVIFSKDISRLILYHILDEGMGFTLYTLHENYGQYKITVTVIQSIPELSKNLDYSIYIRQRSIK